MQKQTKYRVVGLHEDGERVVITKDSPREVAERIFALIEPCSAFAKLLIEVVGESDST